MRVENQAEFDAAIAAGEVIEIYTDGAFEVRGESMTVIRTCDDSRPTIYTCDESRPTIYAYGESRPDIYTCGKSRPDIYAYGKSTIQINLRSNEHDA